MKLHICLGTLTALLCSNALAQTCVTTQPASIKDGQLIDRKDGTLLDVTTNLLWSKCNLGESYNSAKNTCDGTAFKYKSWQDALNATKDTKLTTIAGQTGFRLPNIKELSSIVEYSCTKPAINLAHFPTTTNDPYWTNTPDAHKINTAYDGLIIDFEEALEIITDPSNAPSPLIRLVKEFK
ncbi:DUF1566 domain-containing protein [Vibrio splendidus]|uniref:Lcl C-terminal domain-containing protein n=1 Tax=Vibrio splendidus TaxID=29497 RepID=UPI0007F97D7A|nr:DUF1566 domain-containing protein [Vibrio splendidus]OBT32393.1 hypothetical protein A9262_01070 [Vibrio splendidus]